MSTLLPAPVDPMPSFGYSVAFPDFQPFSARAGIGYQELLESIRYYLERRLVPYVQTFPDAIQGQLDAAVGAITTAVDAALAAEDTRFANTLAEIIAGENAALNDGTILAALESAGSVSLAYLDGRYAPKPTAFGFYLVQGAGIDLTGATDSTAGVNAFLAALPDGSSVRVVSGALYTLSDTLQIGHRIHLHGDGELRWVSGIASKPMIHVTADGTNIDTIFATNPNHLAAQAPATRTYGIFIEANSVRVTDNRIVGQQQAVCVSALGEFHDVIITDNFILDVPGSGDGPASGSSNGEDRGDGIVVWGATAVITGNRVTALDGTDARIGIHTESLPGSEATAYVHGDAHTIIANNIVTGKFRRSITDEGVAFCVITGNTVADATWWGINVSNSGHHSAVVGNVIEWTRTVADAQGSAWSPLRSGIMVYDGAKNVQIKGNIITVAAGAVMSHGITVQASTNDSAHRSVNLQIEGNRISDPAWGMNTGINIVNGSTGTRIIGNDIDGFTVAGIFASHTDEITIAGNRLTGNSANITAKGIACQDGATWAKVTDNMIAYTTTAIALFAFTVFIHTVGNVIRQATNGHDFFGSGSAVATINSNTNINVTTKLLNVPATNVQNGNN